MDNAVESEPSSLSYFELSNHFAWREPRPQEIEQRRTLLNDLLIFDILLRSGGVRSPDTLYPPHDERTLVRLLEAIENSKYDALKKNCLIYFLLKWHQDGREARYATQKCIPSQFVALTEAYWYLDSGTQISYGVSILADARLNRDYASKILQVLNLSSDASALIRKYVRTVKPPLTEPNDIKLFTLALADSSLREAWEFQRKFHETSEIRPRLLRSLLEWCVSPKARPAALRQLLGFPLSSFEESTIHSYVLSPPPGFPLGRLPLLQDLVCVRLIQLGKFIDAIRMGRIFSIFQPVTTISRSQQRLKMVQDLHDTFPPIYCSFADAELAVPPPCPAKPQRLGQRSPGEDVEMTQSWEEIRSSEFQASASKLPVSRPIPERVNAPRFGEPVPSVSTISTPPQLPATTSLVTPHQTPHAPPTHFTSPSSLRSPTSLSNTAERLTRGTLSHVSSPLSYIKFPLSLTQSQKPNGNAFISAPQLQNAFYTPPETNGLIQPIFPNLSRPANGSTEKLSPEQADDVEIEEEKMEDNNDKERDIEHEIDHQEEERAEPMTIDTGEEEIGHSLFDNGLSSRTNLDNEPLKSSDVPDPTESLSTPSTSMKRKVPGSFGDEDEDIEDGDPDQSHRPHYHQEKLSTLPEHEEAESVGDRMTRSEPQYTSAQSPTSRKKTKNDSKELKKRRISQQEFPGALMGDEEEEEDDYVAPLRNTKLASRKYSKPISRRSTSEISDDFVEGMPTRRRSSRLNATASSGGATVASGGGDVDRSTSVRKSARTRKPTVKAPRGKKRGGA